MKLLKFADWQVNLLVKYCERQNGKEIDVLQHLATNKDILASVKHTCEQFHTDCETCPYWLKNECTCAFGWYGKKCLAYNYYEVEERVI